LREVALDGLAEQVLANFQLLDQGGLGHLRRDAHEDIFPVGGPIRDRERATGSPADRTRIVVIGAFGTKMRP
jgi:hypothetical protein